MKFFLRFISLLIFSAFLLCAGILAAEEALSPADSPGTSTQADTAMQAEIEKIQTYYIGAGNFSVQFTQNYHSKITKRVKVSKGMVDFAKPMKMRWDYTEPERSSFITDGQSLWLVHWLEKDIKFNKNLKSSDLESSLAFLWGGDNIIERYAITKLDLPMVEGIIKAEGRVVLELLPREKSQFDVLYLLVDPKTHRIAEVALVDLLGNLNHLVFTLPKLQQTFPKGHFSFKAPGKDWVTTQVDF